MLRSDIFANVKKQGLIAVVRSESASKGFDVINQMIEGGFKLIEVTYTTPNAEKLIFKLSEHHKDNKEVMIGAGTVLDSETARISILNGAKFIVSPSFNKEVAKMCNSYQILYLPGCITPSEIYSAMQYGCDVIKLFPSNIVSPKIIKELNGPFPNIKFVPSGGVNLTNMKEWIDNGALAISVGSFLTKDLKELGLSSVKNNASMFFQAYQSAKNKI